MQHQPRWSLLLSLMAIAVFAVSAARADAQTRTGGRIVRIHAPRLFTIQDADSGRELLVLAPRPVSSAVVGATVVVEGTMRRLVAADMRRTPTSYEIDESTRAQFLGRMALVAKSVIASMKGEAPPATTESQPAEPAPPQPRGLAVEPVSLIPLTVQTHTMVGFADTFAGQEVRILNALVVGVFESNAFLVEPATNYLKGMGQRDRVLVLVNGGALRADPELIVGTPVNIRGVVRTLVGVRMTGEVPWPAQLSNAAVKRLEVRAAILAHSVQTADGVELTNLQPPAIR